MTTPAEALFPNQIDYVFSGLLLALLFVAAIWASLKNKL
jgi:hypothetical protein